VNSNVERHSVDNSQMVDFFHYRERRVARPSGLGYLSGGSPKTTVEKRVKKCTILLHVVSSASASKLRVTARDHISQLGNELGSME
jgi:hypothetical protein